MADCKYRAVAFGDSLIILDFCDHTILWGIDLPLQASRLNTNKRSLSGSSAARPVQNRCMSRRNPLDTLIPV